MAPPNSVNFQTKLHPPQDRSENYPFFQQNKNKKQTSYQMDYLSSDDDFLQPDIFAPYNQEYRGQGVQKPHTNHRIFSPQPIDTQHQQPIQQQNPINTQSFQPIQQQNPMIAHSYQPTQMQNEIPLPYYLQQHEITRNQLSNFSQMPNAAESLQMTMNPYLMGGSSITSNKPLMVFTGTDPEYSVEDYLNAVTANLILNIGPEPINTPLNQNWIHRRTALIQTTLDGAAQKWFSVLPLEIKSNWKRFTQEFSKMFDSERNKQQQRVLCNEIRRLPNETIKQLAVRIETLVRKAYSLNKHDYKNTKMTEILMMTLTPQLRKTAIKKRASHPSSIREPDLDFRKLVDKLEQAEITMKLEETENLKLQYVNRIETASTNINNIQESDTDLVEKITEIPNIYEKHPNFKGKPSFKKWCNYCRRYGHSISECRQKQQDNQNKPQKYKEPNKSFYQYMKKDQNLPNKMYTATIVPENHSRTIQIIQEINHHITQVIEEDHQNEETHKIRHKITTIDQIVEITTPDLIQTQHSLFLDLIPNQEIDTIQTINHETHHIIEIETTLIIEIEVIQTIEISIIQTTDQEITHIIDQTAIIKTDREIIHKIAIQVIIIVIEIIPNHHTGIIITTIILIIATEVVHLNIKDISIKYNLIQKQHQTLQVLMTQ